MHRQKNSVQTHCFLGAGFKHVFISTPIPGEMIQSDEHIFSDGLVQPPTRFFVMPKLLGLIESMIVVAVGIPPMTCLAWACRQRELWDLQGVGVL